MRPVLLIKISQISKGHCLFMLWNIGHPPTFVFVAVYMHDMLRLSWGIKILLANININQQRIWFYLLSAAIWLILSRKIKYLLSSRNWRTLHSYSNCIYELCVFLYCSPLLSRYVLNIISAWKPSFFFSLSKDRKYNAGQHGIQSYHRFR